ncbi:hypothetical protein OG244_15130 [Streptomyces brevispora]|uniref:hypothetical protein n=1 Tax=Streptomyces brevispora TaxID=887462 RepID=UPI002E34A772|nr:hypothetical protein [Streptomyces brevispora]
MPDRRRRTAFRHPLPERASLLMRERRSPTPGSSSSSSSSSPSPSGSSGSSGAGRKDDNPFAPPPENRPDQPWQPRRPVNSGTNGTNGSDENNGDGGDAPEGGSPDNRPVWGSRWSSHQPGRQSGGFGGRPAGPAGPNGQGGGRGGPEGGKSGGTRWDPTDPVQRRARYSLLAGMWAFFFAIFDLPEIALLLGALATYWSISALRAKPKDPSAAGDAAGSAAGSASAASSGSASGQGVAGEGQSTGSVHAPGSPAAPGVPGATFAQRGSRQQTTAAVSGLVTALIALSIVATSFTVQLVYRDYYTCVNDALTKSGQLSCNDLLPKPLEPLFGVKK